MTTHFFSPVLGKRIRTTRLDNCGLPLPAGTPAAYIATDGFITATLSSEVEDGTEIMQRKANGALCVNEKLASNFKRFTLEIQFCGVNPSLLAMVTNAETYADYAGDIAGITIGEGEIDKQFAFELWTGLAGEACLAGEDEASGYMLLPYVQAGVVGDITVDGENTVSFSMTGAYTKGGNQWGVGPYWVVLDDSTPAVPSALPEALDPYDHLLLLDSGLALPPSAAEPQKMPRVAATGAVAGFPGYFTPFMANLPANAAGATSGGVVASPATAWPAGSYVQGSTSGSAGQMHWSGTAWVTGVA